MRIIQHRRHHEHREHRLIFERVAAGGAGFSFACDKAGQVDEANLPLAARGNYGACISGRPDIECKGVIETAHNYAEPAVGECEQCGREVVLHGFTNTCDCGADYNMSGQLLAPRACWGEETGESLADILGVDAASPDVSLE